VVESDGKAGAGLKTLRLLAFEYEEGSPTSNDSNLFSSPRISTLSMVQLEQATEFGQAAVVPVNRPVLRKWRYIRLELLHPSVSEPAIYQQPKILRIDKCV
jgi:hypothetical protein